MTINITMFPIANAEFSKKFPQIVQQQGEDFKVVFEKAADTKEELSFSGIERIEGKSVFLPENLSLVEKERFSKEKEPFEKDDIFFAIIMQSLLVAESATTKEEAFDLVKQTLGKIEVDTILDIESPSVFKEFIRELETEIGETALAKVGVFSIWETIENVETIPFFLFDQIKEFVDFRKTEFTMSKNHFQEKTSLNITNLEQRNLGDLETLNHFSSEEEVLSSFQPQSGLPLEATKQKLQPQNDLTLETTKQKGKVFELEENRAAEEQGLESSKISVSEKPLFNIPFTVNHKLSGFFHSQNQTSSPIEGAFGHHDINEKLQAHQQIIEKIKITQFLDKQEVSLQLYPKQLGKVSLKLFESNGVLIANLKVENDKVKTAMLESKDALIESLKNKGLKVEGFEVEVGSYHFGKQEMEKGRQKSTKRLSDIIRDLQELEDPIFVSNEVAVDIKA